MNAQGWVLDREADWHRLEALLVRSGQKPAGLSADEIREVGLLYRAVTTDLSRARSQERYTYLEPYLNQLARQAHTLVYERPPLRFGEVRRFFLVDFPRCFRKNSRFVLAAFLMFVLGAVLAMITVQANPETAGFFLPAPIIQGLEEGRLWMDTTRAAPSESTFLMQNNIRVAINAYAGGIFFGIGTLLIMFYNGLFAFGGPLQVCILYGVGDRLLSFVAAHGVIELTTIFIAGGGGMMVGYPLLFPGDVPRWSALRRNARESLVLILGCIPLLVVAGLIEGLVSLNQAVPVIIRVSIAALSAVFLVIYLGFSGRGDGGYTDFHKAGSVWGRG